MYEADLTFCANYQDGTSASRELHRVKDTQAKSHDSKRLLSDKRENTQQ